MKKHLAVALAAGTALAACATPPPPPPAPSGPITFRLVSLMGQTPAFDGVTLTLDGPRANGSTGCNTYLAVRDTASNATRPLGWFQVTEIACTEAQMALEQQWLAAMDAAQGVEETGTSVVLKDASGVEIARLVRGVPPAGS